MVAAMNGHTDFVRALLEAGADKASKSNVRDKLLLEFYVKIQRYVECSVVFV